MAKMLGSLTPVGIGGKNCSCCKVPPGKARVAEKRAAKRRDKQSWRREAQG